MAWALEELAKLENWVIDFGKNRNPTSSGDEGDGHCQEWPLNRMGWKTNFADAHCSVSALFASEGGRHFERAWQKILWKKTVSSPTPTLPLSCLLWLSRIVPNFCYPV